MVGWRGSAKNGAKIFKAILARKITREKMARKRTQPFLSVQHMATKRKAPSTSTSSTADSARMTLAKAVSQIAVDQARFTEAVDTYRSIGAESVADLQRQIDVKQQEYDELCEECDNNVKRRKIELELRFQEHKRDTAVAVLRDFGEVPIGETKLAELIKERDAAVAELAEYRASAEESLKTALEALRKELSSSNHAALATAVKTKELEFKATVAKLEAQAEQAGKEVSALKQTIADQREEIKEQRKLTQSVAEASKQGAIQQTFGGK